MDEFQPVKHLVIDDLKTVQIMADPLRSQVLELFGEEPLTVKQVADKLGLAPNRLYYHVNLLEQHGLLRVVETRMVGNMVEKLYHTAAERFEIKADLLSFSTAAGQKDAEQLVLSSLDATREDLLRSMEARRLRRLQGDELEPRQATVTRCLSRLSDAQATDLVARLDALIEEFAQAGKEPSLGGGQEGGEQSNTQTYALAVAFYPTWSFPEEDEP
jgi:DNA-binding transcriptional ArsR family regulator